MFNLESLTQFLHHLVIKIRAIVSNDFIRNPITSDDISFQKSEPPLVW